MLSTGAALVPGRWQHVAVAFSAAGTTFYVDGQAVASDTSAVGLASVPYDPMSAGEPLVLGAQSYQGTAPVFARYFDGWLDEFSVYGRALSPVEIAAIAAAGGAGKCRPTGPTVGPTGLAAAQAPAGPAPREGYAAVFSRAENAVFVLGGTDLATGERLHDLWMKRVDPPGSWVPILPKVYALGKIIDATWSYYDHRLWVLDEPQGKGKKSVRLTRIDPFLGGSWTVGEWPRRPHAKDQWLVVDRDGQVLLASSSTSKKMYAIMRFEVTPFEDTAPIRTVLAARPGRLAFRPSADADGYSFVLKKAGGFVVDRFAQLGAQSAELGDDEAALE